MNVMMWIIVCLFAKCDFGTLLILELIVVDNDYDHDDLCR